MNNDGRELFMWIAIAFSLIMIIVELSNILEEVI